MNIIENKRKYKIIYEIIFTILAITTVTITFLDITEKINLEKNDILRIIDTSILYIFILDYFIRLFISKNKKEFFKNNLPDLIAIVPFNAVFKVFRISKLFRLAKFTKSAKLLRLFGVGGRLHRKIKAILKTNGLNYSLWFAIIVIILGAIGIYLTEKGTTIKTFEDAIWWSFVTATTVGYGDISPSTQIGRFIAAILMLTGIGTIGMITSSISTYFINNTQKIIQQDNTVLIQTIKSNCKDLTEIELKELINYINYIKTKRSN